MNDKYIDFSEYIKQTLKKEGKILNMNDGKIPECISDNFCLPTPKQINNGILTMAFVDMQPLDKVYPLDAGYKAGTLYPSLDKPFYGGMR